MIKQRIDVVGTGYRYLILPEQCPICASAIAPKVLYAITNSALYESNDDGLAAAMSCPSCHRLFVVTYPSSTDSLNWYDRVDPQLPRAKKFDPKIKDISPSFIDIYNQALAAEDYKLDHIAGMGYRKALEFLIKDYAKILDPDEAGNIEKEMLSKVIQKYIQHPKIKVTATASAWLGNDETHYIKKFTDKDVGDLKRLINSCVYWILADYDASDASTMISEKT